MKTKLQYPRIETKTEVEPAQSNYYPAIILMLTVVLGILGYFYYQINKPPVLLEKQPLVGYEHVISIYGHHADRLARPTEVAVDADQNIYVADTNNHRIMIFDSEGTYLRQIGESGDGPGQIKYPSGLAVDDDKNVYILSRTQNKMIVYSDRNEIIREVYMNAPLAVTVKDGRAYITTDRGVMIGDAGGELLSSFGARGTAPGDVDHPTGIAVNDKKQVFVADSLNYRVQAFNRNGESMWTLGNPPTYQKEGEIRDSSRKFGLPAGLALGGEGDLYLVDAQAGEIVIINTKGREMTKFGGWGHDDGQFYYPAGIAYMGDDKFVVADKFNDRIQVVRFRRDNQLPSGDSGGPSIFFWPLIILLVSGALAARSAYRKRLFKKRAPSAMALIGLGLLLLTASCRQSYPAVPEPAAAPQRRTFTVTVYLPRADGTLSEVSTSIPEPEKTKDGPRAALKALFKADKDFFPPGVEVLGVEVDSKGLALVNLSRHILDKKAPDAQTEALGLGAIVRTMAEFKNVKQVRIEVEGRSAGSLDGWPIEKWWGFGSLKAQPFEATIAAP